MQTNELENTNKWYWK